ncbi:MAG: hypothetical protein IJU92_04005 [Spirochaetaceae bacterium]|nr:hypothetical protein [Spirochaetaceae bacterium]
MLRKFLLVCLLCCSLFSCGIMAGTAIVEIHVQHENGSVFTVSELESLRFLPPGNVEVQGKADGDEADKNKEGCFVIIYYVGSSRSKKRYDKLYQTKKQNFSFTISCPYGKYEDYHMDFSDPYEEIGDYHVKYTVTLKEK